MNVVCVFTGRRLEILVVTLRAGLWSFEYHHSIVVTIIMLTNIVCNDWQKVACSNHYSFNIIIIDNYNRTANVQPWFTKINMISGATYTQLTVQLHSGVNIMLLSLQCITKN